MSSAVEAAPAATAITSAATGRSGGGIEVGTGTLVPAVRTGSSAAAGLPAFQNAEKCSLCKNQFNMNRRRHHCRNCGHSICTGCSAGVVMPSSPDPQRGCTTCVRLILGTHHHRRNSSNGAAAAVAAAAMATAASTASTANGSTHSAQTAHSASTAVSTTTSSVSTSGGNAGGGGGAANSNVRPPLSTSALNSTNGQLATVPPSPPSLPLADGRSVRRRPSPPALELAANSIKSATADASAGTSTGTGTGTGAAGTTASTSSKSGSSTSTNGKPKRRTSSVSTGADGKPRLPSPRTFSERTPLWMLIVALTCIATAFGMRYFYTGLIWSIFIPTFIALFGIIVFNSVGSASVTINPYTKTVKVAIRRWLIYHSVTVRPLNELIRARITDSGESAAANPTARFEVHLMFRRQPPQPVNPDTTPRKTTSAAAAHAAAVAALALTRPIHDPLKLSPELLYRALPADDEDDVPLLTFGTVGDRALKVALVEQINSFLRRIPVPALALRAAAAANDDAAAARLPPLQHATPTITIPGSGGGTRKAPVTVADASTSASPPVRATTAAALRAAAAISAAGREHAQPARPSGSSSSEPKKRSK